MPLRKIIASLLLLAVLDYVIGTTVKSALMATDSFWGPNRAVRVLKSSAPGLIMGNSRAGLIDPTVLQQKIGARFYNGTAPGQGIDYHLILLDQLISTGNTPRLLIYEMDRHDFISVNAGKGAPPAEMLSFLYDDSPVAREILTHKAMGNRLRYLSKLYQVNGTLGSVFIDLFFRDRRDRVSRDDGFTARQGSLAAKACLEAPRTSEFAVDAYRLALFERFLDLAKNNGIKVFLTTSPLYLECATDYSAVFDQITEMADSRSVPYLSMFQDMQDPALFFDSNHLNVAGAQIYTGRVADWMATISH